MTAWETAIAARSPYFWTKFDGTGVPTNSGSVSTTLTLSGTAPTYSTAGLSNSAYTFAGLGEYTLSTWSSTLNGNSWTIEAVASGDGVVPANDKILFGMYESSTKYVWVGFGSSNTLSMGYNGGAGAGAFASSPEKVNGGSYHHIALVYNASATTLKLYLNGRLLVTRTINLNSVNFDGAFKNLGGYQPSTAYRWAGSIDEFAIIPGVLSDADIAADNDSLGLKYRRAVFNSSTSPNAYFAHSLPSGTPLNEGTGTTSTSSIGTSVTRNAVGNSAIGSTTAYSVAANNQGFIRYNLGTSNISDRTFSFEFWMKSSASVIGSNQKILYSTGTDFYDLDAVPTSGGNAKLVATISFSNGTTTTVDTGKVINDNQWHHIVFTHDGTTTTAQTTNVYVDGVQYSSGPLSRGLLTNVSAIPYLGSSLNTTMAATYDDFAWYNGVLTSTDVTNHYNASIASTNAGYTAQVMTISNSVFVDPVVTAQSFVNVNPLADPMNATALFVDPTVTVTTNYVFNASPLTADGSFPAPQLAYLHIRTQYREDRPTTITPNVKYVQVNHNASNSNLYNAYETLYPILGKANTHRVYWKFDSSNLTSADIYKAEMRMISDEGTSQTVDLQFYRVTGSWALETITHNTQPASTLVQNDGVDYVFGTGGAIVYVDIKTLLTNLIDNADTGFMMELASTSTDTQLDLAGYEFEFRIWTYTQPTNDSLTDIPQTASSTFVMPAILAGTDAGYTAQAMTASALNTNVTITADRNISYAANIMQVDAQHPDAVAFTSSDVSLTFGTGATASAELVNPTLALVFNLSVAGSPFEASSSLVEPLLSASNTQTVTPATGQAELLAGTSISTGVNFIPDPMYITNSLIIDPELYIVAVEEILADPMNATAGFPDSISVTTSVNVIANPWIVNASMPGGGISIDEIDLGGPMPAQADIIDPTRSLGVGIIGTPMTANASFDNPTIYSELGVDNVAGVMNATSATMVNPVVGVWDGYAAEVMTATARFIAPATPIYIPKWEYLIDRLYAEKTIYDVGGALGGTGGSNPFLGSYSYTTGPGNRIAVNVTREKLPDVQTNTNNMFANIGTDSSTVPEESVLLPAIKGGTTSYPLPAGITSTGYEEDAGVVAGLGQVDCKYISAEYIIKSSKPNQTLSFGKGYDNDNDQIISTRIAVEGGYPVFEYIQQDLNTKEVNTFKYTGTTRVDDNKWHHILVQTTDGSNYYRFDYSEQFNTLGTNSRNFPREVINEKGNVPFTTEAIAAVEIYVDGEVDTRAKFDLDLTKYWVPSPHYFGQEYWGWNLVQNPSTGTFSRTLRFYATSDDQFSGQLSGFAVRTTRDAAQKNSDGLLKYQAAVSPTTVKWLAKYALEVYSIEASASTASAVMVEPVITTNTKQILRLYFNANNATGQMSGANTNMHDVITYSVLNETENNPNYLYNADAAYLGNNTNPDSAATEIVVDAWRGTDGYRRLINLQSDVVNYSEIDAIMFMDYPNDSDEMDNLMPGYDKSYVKTKITEFLSSVREAVDDGKSLFVSSPQLAFDLGIVSSVEFVSQGIQSGTTPTDVFGDSLSDTFFDNVRNNKYKIVATEAGLTDIASHIMVDAIGHTGEKSDDYHIKYANRPNGLQVNDTFVIPSLPITNLQTIRDVAGSVGNRIGTSELAVFNESDIKAGRVIAKLADTNYVTTIALKKGDILNGTPLGGRIIVNCVEDALAMGLEEYNYGKIQVVSVNDPNEDANTIQWQYSTSRTTKKLEIDNNVDIYANAYGQTYPSNGGGGGIVQAATHTSGGNIRAKYDQNNDTFTSGIYYDVNSEKYALDTIPVFGMTYRAINWLLQVSDANTTFVGGPSMTAQASIVTPTIVGQIIDPLPAVNKSVAATPMTAQATLVTNIDALFGNINAIVLTLHHQDVITLYIEQEKL